MPWYSITKEICKKVLLEKQDHRWTDHIVKRVRRHMNFDGIWKSLTLHLTDTWQWLDQWSITWQQCQVDPGEELLATWSQLSSSASCSMFQSSLNWKKIGFLGKTRTGTIWQELTSNLPTYAYIPTTLSTMCIWHSSLSKEYYHLAP